ncbi:hypothetical protein C8R34_12324 [Nitrosomonas sp. Nm84]|uniref:hypothetical protein n=1 Tax=Nitrosomonas sp. Nm84 TaxID=200124 RepID=UPI000D76CBBC|nr:hypothetical protein [Nitrosomonas sp. Nm84]PXW84935.1 hypothetical protein C8R34_12324 [Nitrosomonas sp. Nm84]
MLNIKVQKFLQVIFVMTTVGYAALSNAHEVGATMDPNGNVAGFTGFALVSCSSEGNIPTDHFVASIKDTSPPQDNLLVNLQIIHVGNGFNHAISTTDPISGDDEFSPPVSVQGGNSSYLLLVNKTGEGARSFIISYHCQSADNPPVHTVTSENPVVYQFE